MTEYSVGVKAKTLVEITDEDGREVIPPNVVVMVVGFTGNRLVLDWTHPETGKAMAAIADPWELLRITPRGNL